MLHYPGKDKIEEFNIAVQQKRASEDFDFQGVWFPDKLYFINFEFSKKADFGEPLRLGRSFTYSLGVMSLQKPDPKPLTDTAHALVTLETILGPAQAALLALAIRRKFMRWLSSRGKKRFPNNH